MVISTVPERKCVQRANPNKICKLKKPKILKVSLPLFPLPVFGENKVHLLITKIFLIWSH